eukprot:c19771_g1_i1.p1 GENE.c19771_g1_i1~~c19771_g1_i1.p1  ORF type:complete len:390 (+),score=59.86 c19771_g1_i1:148-1317(+)
MNLNQAIAQEGPGHLIVQVPDAVIKTRAFPAQVTVPDRCQARLQPDRERSVVAVAVDAHDRPRPDVLHFQGHLAPETRSLDLSLIPLLVTSKVGSPVRIRVMVSDGTTTIEGISMPIQIRSQKVKKAKSPGDDVGMLTGVGPVYTTKFKEHGIVTVMDLAKTKLSPSALSEMVRDQRGSMKPQKMQGIIEEARKISRLDHPPDPAIGDPHSSFEARDQVDEAVVEDENGVGGVQVGGTVEDFHVEFYNDQVGPGLDAPVVVSHARFDEGDAGTAVQVGGAAEDVQIGFYNDQVEFFDRDTNPTAPVVQPHEWPDDGDAGTGVQIGGTAEDFPVEFYNQVGPSFDINPVSPVEIPPEWLDVMTCSIFRRDLLDSKPTTDDLPFPWSHSFQ